MVYRTHNVNAGGRLLIAVLLFFATAALVTQDAGAHGGGAPQITRAPAGPYLVFAWTSPEPWRVGSAHTTVAVTKPLADGKEMPITGAQVVIVYTPVADPANPVRAAAVEQAGSVGFYEADAEVGSAGEWRVTVEVSGPEGSGSTEFSTQVLPSNSFNWWLIGGAGLVLLAVIGVLGTRRRRPARAGRQVTGTTRSEA